MILLLATAFVGCSSDEPTDKKVDETPANTDTAFVKTTQFTSVDGLEITADHFHIGMDKPVIILCHQAGSSRGEYHDIAVELNSMGFNCIALDQRSGNASQGIINETAKRAKAAGKGQTYLDAEQDIVAAIAKFSADYNKNVIIWGSSYSSSLVLKIAGNNDKVDKVLSFSPGEYLTGIVVSNEAKKVTIPAFLTSAKNEESQTKTIYTNLASSNKTQFVSTGAGRHGSSCLWPTEQDAPEYWVAVKLFLGV